MRKLPTKFRKILMLHFSVLSSQLQYKFHSHILAWIRAASSVVPGATEGRCIFPLFCCGDDNRAVVMSTWLWWSKCCCCVSYVAVVSNCGWSNCDVAVLWWWCGCGDSDVALGDFIVVNSVADPDPHGSRFGALRLKIEMWTAVNAHKWRCGGAYQWLRIRITLVRSRIRIRWKWYGSATRGADGDRMMVM